MTIISAFAMVLALVFIMLNAVSKFSKHIQIIAGEKFKEIIQTLTVSPFRGTIVGTLFTSLVQSSAATMIMTVSLVDSGIMSFYNSLGIMFGANIGTTLTSQLVAVNFSLIAPYIIIIGFLIQLLDGEYKRYGKTILYFGIIFLTLGLIGDVVAGLQQNHQFISLFESLHTIPLAIVFGALATIIFQSSTITSAIAVILTGQALISVPIAIGVILGANIGSTSTSLFASLFLNKAAKKTAVAHVFYNIIGVGLTLPFFNYFYSFIEFLGGGVEQQVANAHVFFNIFSAVLFLIFIKPFALLVEWASTFKYFKDNNVEQKINF